VKIVNVVSTCKKAAEVPEEVPHEELKNGKKYYFVQEGVVAIVFNTGKAKLFSSRYPPPNLPYFSDCRIDNIVAVAEIPAMSIEELFQLLEKRGFAIGDREKVNAVLAYRGKTTVRIFPKTGSDVYKIVIFASSESDVKEAVRLLAPTGITPQG
jgi:hypothetical protein